ncbi:MAG: hypothetical protein RR297_11550 [Clostridia bacterium]
MLSYEVGKSIHEFVGQMDGVYFSMDKAGALVTVLLRDPDSSEVDAFKQGKPLRMGIFYRKNQMVMLFKFAEMDWMDAPYSPHIGEAPVLPDDIPDGQSIAMQIMLANTRDGVIKSLRLFSPPTKFARELVKTIKEIQQLPFDKGKYNQDLNALFCMYSTRMMLDEAIAICKAC